jgi:hypothetical protein
MQFYFRQFAADERVMAMDLDAVGAHILLMCAAGASPEGCKIPADERMIRTIIRTPKNVDFLRIKAQLLSGAWKVSRNGKWWVQKGLQRSMLKVKVFRDEQKRKSKLGNDTRWGCPRTIPTGTIRRSPSYPSSSSSSSSSALQKKESLAHAVVVEVSEPQTAGAKPSPSEVQKAIGKTAQQLSLKANRNGSTGLRAHIEAGIFRKKIEDVYIDATQGGIAPTKCILQAVHEGALSLMTNRSVELKGLTHQKLGELAWAKIAPSADTINSMKNFEIRSKQIVAIATRCVTDAAMEFLAARKE